MKNVCFCDETWDLFVEAEVSADPVWCNRCKANLDLELIPITEELKEELTEWNTAFGDHLASNQYDGITASFAEWLNEQGEILTQKLSRALSKRYVVRYCPYVAP